MARKYNKNRLYVKKSFIGENFRQVKQLKANTKKIQKNTKKIRHGQLAVYTHDTLTKGQGF